MTTTYKAWLTKDNKVHWHDAAPRKISKQTPILVSFPDDDSSVTLNDTSSAIKFLSKLAMLDKKSLDSIDDPVSWQKEQRRDKNITGRKQ